MKINVRTATVRRVTDPRRDRYVVEGLMRLIFHHEGEDWSNRRFVYAAGYEQGNDESLMNAWSHVTAEITAMAEALTGERVPRPREDDFKRGHWSWRDEETHDVMSRAVAEFDATGVIK